MTLDDVSPLVKIKLLHTVVWFFFASCILAARYTPDRAANFDIYLPAWLARNYQNIFGTLFVAGGLLVLWKWMSSR